MREIAFTGSATRQWLNLSVEVRKRLDTKLTEFARNGQGDVTILKGREGARLRVGNWRIIFLLKRDTITVIAVGHRREVYK